ncbi:MAG TPA: FAD-dependent oxidoreductase [Anaerolineae bacterium]|nr:FAD-dependent oxidoreductase [Anaerolineae bacterium]
MFFSTTPRQESLQALADVKLMPFWLDDKNKPQKTESLKNNIETDLCIIGGGFTGLWSALLAKQRDPNRDVVLIEANEIAYGASGRNGGFCSASLTHGFLNGVSRWEKEFPTLLQMGRNNLDEIENTIKQFNIECDFIRSGEINVAVEPHHIDDIHEEVELSKQYGVNAKFLSQDEIRARVNSPSYLGAIFDPDMAMLNPTQLAWGLRETCLRLGVRLYEGTQVESLEEKRDWVIIKTQFAKIESKKVALATNAFPPLIKSLSYYVVPVYDYALMTEPLSKSQRDAIGWHGREGLSDLCNQFHYYRTTADNRILFGGYDAIYYQNNKIDSDLENNPASFALLAEHFFQTFPQLEGLRFTHAWGGVIDTSSRYTAFWDTVMNGKVAYSLGYTGLGVGASRFGANVMLDLLSGEKTERTELQMVKSKPFPFPPEPLRSPIINFTRWSLKKADEHAGKRNLWLKLLDGLGLGFDS